MQILDFNKFYDYFQNLILEKKAALNKVHAIKEDFNMLFFDNSGDYLATADQIQYIEDSPQDRRVLVNIMNGGGIQDSEVAIDSYLQIVSIELLALEEQREDIITLFTTIVAENKSKVESLSGATVQITMDDFPEYGDQFQAHGYEKFTMTLSINIVVVPGAKLSNAYQLAIDGVPVRYDRLIMTRDNELISDLKKRESSKFFTNTTGFQLKVSGLFVENSAVASLLSDCASNQRFNTFYSLSLKSPETDSSILGDANFRAKNITFVFAYGTIVSWEALFYEGTSV